MDTPTNAIILFDVAVTLVYREQDVIDFEARLIAELAGEPVERIHMLLANHPHTALWYTKALSPFRTLEQEDTFASALFLDVLNQCGLSRIVPSIMRRYKSQGPYKLLPHAIPVLEHFRAGNTLGIITNGRPSRRRTLKQLGIDGYFDDAAVFISDEIGAAKPDAAIFKYVENAISGPLVLVDDEYANLHAAKARGWQAVHIDTVRSDAYTGATS